MNMENIEIVIINKIDGLLCYKYKKDSLTCYKSLTILSISDFVPYRPK